MLSYKTCIDYLFNALPVFQHTGGSAYKPGLQVVENLLDRLGNPHLKFPSIHIAGTNGKGSTSHLLSSVLQETGIKVGLFTSPHLIDFRERIRINGKMISEAEVINFVETYRALLDEVKPSFFEMSVALAFLYFAQQKVDVAVIETGMGGRLDATNIITPLLSIITNIDFDHTQFLGKTITEIASEKAGIIKPNIPIIIGERQELTTKVFTEKAKNSNSPIIFTEGGTMKISDFLEICPLKGIYQEKNLCTVLTATKVLKDLNHPKISISETAIKQGISNVLTNTHLRGRWEILSDKPLIICDVAHNLAGWRYTKKQLLQYQERKKKIVLGFVSDKDYKPILELLPKDAEYFFCAAQIPRALSTDILLEDAKQFNLHGRSFSSVKEAFITAFNESLEAQSNDLILISGSNFIVAEALPTADEILKTN